MSENQSVRRRKVLSVILVIIISGAVITSAFLFLTYPRPEIETLLIDEIDITFGGLDKPSASFNLTIPSMISQDKEVIHSFA